MKKLWEITVSTKLEPEVQRKIRSLLHPVSSVNRPENCIFCDTKTTWTINNKPVCPACTAKYGFIKADRIPDLCEVCGQQGEWCTDGEPVHSLCYKHRDDWFHWKVPELDFINHGKQPEKWNQVWDENWRKFVAFMKERADV